jgi:hypothetical protein
VSESELASAASRTACACTTWTSPTIRSSTSSESASVPAPITGQRTPPPVAPSTSSATPGSMSPAVSATSRVRDGMVSRGSGAGSARTRIDGTPAAAATSR